MQRDREIYIKNRRGKCIQTVDLKDGKEIAKQKIKYFRIKPNKIAGETAEYSRKYSYKSGDILELRSGQLEKMLIKEVSCPPELWQNIKLWDYRKPFDYKSWI